MNEKEITGWKGSEKGMIGTGSTETEITMIGIVTTEIWTEGLQWTDEQALLIEDDVHLMTGDQDLWIKICNDAGLQIA